jgi:hypothetical protein
MATGEPMGSDVLSFREAGLSFEMNRLMGLMKRRSSSLLWLTALAGMAASPALAQIRPMGVAPPAKPRTAAPVPTAKPATPATKSGARPAPDALAPNNPDFKADQPSAAEAAPLPPPLPPAVWDIPNALQLLTYVQQIGVEGLNPEDYDPAGLQAAIQTGNPAVISPAPPVRSSLLLQVRA